MGTRSLTVIKADEWDVVEEIAVLYRQYDGYPEGHGTELANFLKQFNVVNGLFLREEGKTANGATCLAAQLVAHFKGDIAGGFYLYPAGKRNLGEEYTYTVIAGHNKPIVMQMQSAYGEESFSGCPSDFAAWIQAQADEEAEARTDYAHPLN
jgi:hypothetical protein